MPTYLDDFFDYQGHEHLSDDALIFPIGEGWEIALHALATFPFGTKIYKTQSGGVWPIFLSNANPKKVKDVMSDKYFHLSVYVEDLLKLHELGYIEGVKPATEFEYRLHEFNSLLKAGYPTNNEGDIDLDIPIPELKKPTTIISKPRIEKYLSEYLGEAFDEKYRDEMIKEYERNNKPYIIIEDHIMVTEDGKDFLLRPNQNFALPERIAEEVNQLIQISCFDDAVRRVAILFEKMMRGFHQSTLFGQQLIELHIKECIKANRGKYNAGLKIYRQELRTFFKYTRNEFAHNNPEIDRFTYNSILFRQVRLFELMEQAFKKLLAN